MQNRIDGGGGGSGSDDSDRSSGATDAQQEAARRLLRGEPSGIDAGEPVSGVERQGSPRDDSDPSPVEGGSDSVDGMGGGNSSQTNTPTRGSGSGGSRASSSSDNGRRETTTGIDTSSRDAPTPDNGDQRPLGGNSEEIKPPTGGPGAASGSGSGQESSEDVGGDKGLSADEAAAEVVTRTHESGIEEPGVGNPNFQSQAEQLEADFIQQSQFANDGSDVAVKREGDQLVATLSRSAAVDVTKQNIQDFMSSAGERNPRRIFAGTERIPVGVDVGPEDIVLTATGDGTVGASFTDDTQQEIAEQNAALKSGGVEGGARSSGDIVVQPGETSASDVKQQFAGSREGVEPSDVEVVREDGEIVGARAEVQSTGQAREKQFLPSVDIDVSDRSVSYESGDISAAPDPTPARVFGTIVGMDEEEIESFEDRADEKSADLQGAPPAGLGGGRTLPVRGAAAAAGILATGALAANGGRTSSTTTDATVTSTASVSEVDVGSGVTQTEVGLGSISPASELEAAESRADISELEPGSGGASTTTVEPSSVGTTEIALPSGTVGGEASETAGEDTSVVPGEYPLPGRDVPRNPQQDRPEQVTPGDYIRPGISTSPAQQQVRGEEASVVDNELRRRRRSQQSELEEILSGPEGNVMIGEEPTAGFPAQRSFPTGAGAVVGSELARTQDAQTPEVTQETNFGLNTSTQQTQTGGVGQRGITGGRGRGDTSTAPIVAGGTKTDVSQMPLTGQQTAAQALTGSATGGALANESLYGEEYINENAASTVAMGQTQGALSEFDFPPADSDGKDSHFEVGAQQFEVSIATPDDVVSFSDSGGFDFGI